GGIARQRWGQQEVAGRREDEREAQRTELERVDHRVEPLPRGAPGARESRDLTVGRVERVPEDEEQPDRDRDGDGGRGERDEPDPGERGERAEQRHLVRREARDVRGRGEPPPERPVDEARVRGRTLRGLLPRGELGERLAV